MLQRIYIHVDPKWARIDAGEGAAAPIMYAFIKQLRNRDHVRRYSILPTDCGWEVLEEQDNRVVRHVCYTDWHRVERARRAFSIQVSNLKNQGWETVAD